MVKQSEKVGDQDTEEESPESLAINVLVVNFIFRRLIGIIAGLPEQRCCFVDTWLTCVIAVGGRYLLLDGWSRDHLRRWQRHILLVLLSSMSSMIRLSSGLGMYDI